MKSIILFSSAPLGDFKVKEMSKISIGSADFVYVDLRLGLVHGLDGADLICISRFRGRRIIALIFRSLNLYSKSKYLRKVTQIQFKELTKNSEMQNLIMDATALVSIHDAQLPLVWELTKVADKPAALRGLSSLHKLNGV